MAFLFCIIHGYGYWSCTILFWRSFLFSLFRYKYGILRSHAPVLGTVVFFLLFVFSFNYIVCEDCFVVFKDFVYDRDEMRWVEQFVAFACVYSIFCFPFWLFVC